MVGWSISTMPVDFLKGMQSESSRVVEVQPDNNGVYTITMSDLVAIDSRSDVLVSVLEEHEEAGEPFLAQVTEVGAGEEGDGGDNDVTVIIYDQAGEPVDGGEIDPIEVAVNARGF